MTQRGARKITVALAGNPNVGKSTLFNVLTGLHQHTGNWAGKTVGLATGQRKQGEDTFVFVDLPGTYTLRGGGEDEKIAARYIESGEADCVVVVCDASSLERSLFLLPDILCRANCAVVCVNLIDEAEKKGIVIDCGKLAETLGVSVVPVSAKYKRGINDLLDAIRDCGPGECPACPADPIAFAHAAAESCCSRKKEVTTDRQTKIDKRLTGKRYGIPVALLLLFAIVWVTVWGANYPSQLLEKLFEKGYVWLLRLLSSAPVWLRGILADGIYATATRVVAVMLPPMAIFFPLFTVLEDIGYLPRMAFLLDHGMQRCGGCGKQAMPLCMGLGCNAVGVVGCRIIDSPRERLAAILTNAMVPCNGRFPTLILLGSMFFPGGAAALLVAACVALGAAGAMAVSAVLCKTVLKARDSTFVMEMPPFRCPRLGQVLVRSALDRVLVTALRAVAVAAPAGAVLWLLARDGFLQRIAVWLDPLGAMLGMNGIILLAFVFCLPANELLIPIVMMVVLRAESVAHIGAHSANALHQAGFTPKMAICTMVFTLFHWPCATTLLTVYKETHSIGKTAAAFVLPTAVGVVLCLILNLLL